MENLAENTSRLPDLLILFCKWYWSIRSLIWGTILLNIILSVIIAFLFTSPSNLPKASTIIWFIHNPIPMLIVFLCVFTLTIISGIVSKLPVIISASLRQYLRQMIMETELLATRGIPAGLIMETVQLDQVFIPLQLRANFSRTDYPLTDDELEGYRQNLKATAAFHYSSDLERIVVDAERNRQFVFKKSDRISIDDMWKYLTPDHPAIVIQGYPGTGKSILMERLVLYMARSSLRLPDQVSSNVQIKPPLIPILIRLSRFASAPEQQQTELSIDSYLSIILADVGSYNASDAIRQKLIEGFCLVIFDGLDEISDLDKRKKVQNAIRAFVRNHRSNTVTTHFNRFLITSRAAGYDQAAFPDYRHFTVANLSDEQIDYFLLRWCRANASQTRESAPASGNVHDPFLEQETKRRLAELETAIKGSQAVHDLAENPLLLTLLAVMQQNSIALPRQRVELYKTVTLTLLENRNIVKNLIPIPENQAIQYLGPLAFTMQETGNSFARERDVLDSLQKAIDNIGASPEQAAIEAREFLSRIRERGGLFVQRTGDYFGFMHRTFQDYFAARYILNQIKTDPDHWIAELVRRARQPNALWREPFLLAVAYQSYENEKVADEIIRSLLDIPQSADQEQCEHDLLLAAECVIEAKPLSIDTALERHIVNQLLQTYKQAQNEQRFDPCQQIENMIRRWLLGLPKGINRLTLLTVLREAITNTANTPLQRATLTMLAMIAQNLADCPANVFAALIPPLLALADLPAVGNCRPAADIVASANLVVSDLALTVLSFLGKTGPSGLLLADVRQHFKDHPNHLRLLARYSLESGALITPCVVPLAEEKYQLYEAAIAQWIKLRDTQQTVHISKQTIDSCLSIHQSLLDCAEEVMYPTATLLLELLQQSAAQPDLHWQEVWKTYLVRQLATNSYINYQQAALLWTMLFTGEPELYILGRIVLKHYGNVKYLAHIYARYFLLNLCTDLNEQENLRTLRDLRDIEHLWIYRSIQNLHDLGFLQQRRAALTSSNKEYSEIIQCLRKILFTHDLTEETLSNLRVVDKSVRTELLTILKGRVLQISEEGNINSYLADEVQKIIRATSVLKDAQEVYEAAIAITKLLNVRSEGSNIELQLPPIREQDIQEIRSAIGNKTFRHYAQLAEAIMHRMDIVDSIGIKSSHFPAGTVWEIMLPDIGLRIKTNKALLFLRQEKVPPARYTELTELAGNCDLIFIMDIAEIPFSLFQRSPHTIWFSPQSLLEMIETPDDELAGWLARFITTKLERTVREALLPYRTTGTAGDSFVGRENELARLMLAEQYGGMIIGAHRSGKTSLLDQLGKKLRSADHNVIGRFDISGAGFQTFFERTLNHLGVVVTGDMTPESWAAILRKQTSTVRLRSIHDKIGGKSEGEKKKHAKASESHCAE